MHARSRRVAAFLLAVLFSPFTAFAAAGDDAGLARLQSEIEQIAREAGGRVGVAVQHIESGRQLYVNRTERFPMASAFKVALAVQLLALVEQGHISLDKVVTLRRGDLRPGSGTLVQVFNESQADLSLGQLLELMLIHSDNSATDILWKEAGGSEAIAARLASLGLQGISVDRPTAGLLAAAAGIEPLPPENQRTPARFRELSRKLSQQQKNAAVAAFFDDPRDTATPEAMVDLMLKIWQKEALGPESSAHLLDIMYRCATGRARLTGMLPSEARVAHKTGSLQIGVTNDVGIVHLPDGAGHMAIAVMVRESPKDVRTQERTIARIAWASYKYFSAR